MPPSKDLQIVGDEENNQSAMSGPSPEAMDIATTRASAEIQSAMVIAKKFPRDENRAFTRILQSCKRKNLADAAIYSFPRGDQQVEGPSIRLAEEMARNWGNVDFGIIELEQREGESTCMSYAWDLETNTRQTKIFTVSHKRVSGRGPAKRVTMLEDPRDIYEMVANQGARRLRACILGIIPGDIVEAAVEQCNKTMAEGEAAPLIDRVRRMATAFADFGISTVMLEKRLAHRLDATSEAELNGLRKIYQSIRDGMATRESYFELGDKQERPPAPDKAPQGVAAATGKTEPKPETKPEPKTEAPAQTETTEPAKRQKAPKPASDAKAEKPAIDIPATTVPEKEEDKKEPKTQLADKETFVAIVSADEIAPEVLGNKPGLRLELSGEYSGTAYFVGGAKVDPENPERLLVDPSWSLDRKFRAEILGVHQKSSGQVLAFVRKVEPV